ncbi:hypothetical protein SmJEL517_g04787 [Synchytrium microbalum]|uniref:Uncharacterized protein n=1 Tax=Synchytrium microbalum TaxID=1806994 RepID=A0A507BSM9_9FUNG|nr:uncharacterized protein SmJEL517_g04787 [Synchytrium microbalum]TPX32067.1 hypothetical protein SmJEL517_g04787 [Synchytrium microbalum]
MASTSSSSSNNNNEDVYAAYEQYDFDNNVEFQRGVKSITQNSVGRSDEDLAIAVNKAKWFYYCKFVQKFDYEAYLTWKNGSSTAATSASTGATTTDAQKPSSSFAATAELQTDDSEQPKYPRSFAELCEMVARGEPIPGIRQIPNKLNEGTPSQATLAPRKKPWEKTPESADLPDEAAATV